MAVGASAVYLLMPRGRRTPMRTGAVLAVAALAGLMVFVGRESVFAGGGLFYFMLLSSIALFGGVRVITHGKPVYSAVYFVLVVVSTAGLMLMLMAEFLAVATVLIYAGAIMVTYVFVIMLAQQSGSPAYDASSHEPLLAVAVGFLLSACVAGLAGDAAAFGASASAGRSVTARATSDDAADASSDAAGSNTLRVGEALLTRHLLAFELAGVLLLVAMVGAIALVKRRLDEAEPVGPLRAEPPAPGKIGREAEPF